MFLLPLNPDKALEYEEMDLLRYPATRHYIELGLSLIILQVYLHTQLGLQHAISPEYLGALQIISPTLHKKKVMTKWTYPAFPILTNIASVNLPALTRAWNQSFKSPVKEPEN